MSYPFYDEEKLNPNARDFKKLSYKQISDLSGFVDVFREYINPVEEFYLIDTERLSKIRDYLYKQLDKIGKTKIPRATEDGGYPNFDEMISDKRIKTRDVAKFGVIYAFFNLVRGVARGIEDEFVSPKSQLTRFGFEFMLKRRSYEAILEEFGEDVAVKASGILVFRPQSNENPLLGLVEIMDKKTLELTAMEVLDRKTPLTVQKFRHACNTKRDPVTDDRFTNLSVQIFNRPSDVGKKGLAECYRKSTLKSWFEREDTEPDEYGAIPVPITEWTENNRNTGRRVFKLPISGSWIDAKSADILVNSDFNVFIVSNERRVKIGSRYGVSTLHGVVETVKTLKPVVRKRDLIIS